MFRLVSLMRPATLLSRKSLMNSFIVRSARRFLDNQTSNPIDEAEFNFRKRQRRGRRSSSEFFFPLLMAISIGCYVVSKRAEEEEEKAQSTEYDSISHAIKSIRSDSPVSTFKSIYSAMDFFVPNEEAKTHIVYPSVCRVSTHRVVEIPMSSGRTKASQQRVKYGMEPLSPMTMENIVSRAAQLLGVGSRQVSSRGGPAFSFGLYVNQEVFPDVLELATSNRDIVPNVRAVILSHDVIDKTIRLVLAKEESGANMAKTFTSLFSNAIDNGSSTGVKEDGAKSGKAALELLCETVSLIPKLNRGDEIVLTWAESGNLVVTLPDHSLDHLDFYTEIYQDAHKQRERLRDSQEWKDIVAKIRTEKPAFPAPSLSLSQPLRPAVILNSPTLCRSIFESFIDSKGVSADFSDELQENWRRVLEQYKGSGRK